MYKPHPCCTAPQNKNTKVWRYMDIAKLLSMLESDSLWFPNITHLDNDPLEGFLNRATVEEFKEKSNGHFEENLESIKKARNLLNVSSWHINEGESAAMWQLYLRSDEGIAIQTTVERLEDSFKKSQEDVMLSVVKYIDEDSDKIDWTEVINYALCKRKSFQHENEIRAIVLSEGEKHSGLPIDIELTTLIEKIFVAPNSPHWIHKLIEKVIKRYGLDVPVEQSRLYADPLY